MPKKRLVIQDTHDTLTDIMNPDLRSRNIMDGYLSHVFWNAGYEKYLKEFQDNSQIKSLPLKEKIIVGHDVKCIYYINSNKEFTIWFEDMENKKNEFNQNFVKHYDLVVQVRFMINDKETIVDDSSFEEFKDMMKTVQNVSNDYIKEHKPGSIMYSTRPSKEINNLDDTEEEMLAKSAKYKEICEADNYRRENYYRKSILHLYKTINHTNYRHDIGPVGPYSRYMMYLHIPPEQIYI